MTASITFFPVGNGDMTLITFDNDQKLLVDLHARKAADDDDDDTPDVMTDLRGRLTRDEKGREDRREVDGVTSPNAERFVAAG